VTVSLFVGLAFVIARKPNNDTQNLQNVETIDGMQYVTINAKGGYFPRVSEAKAGIPTKLIIETKGTYDCSLALVIRSINYQKLLNKTGEEVIDIGVPVSGVPLVGTCSMGMYSFTINFL
jgi:plastocyanin domain-containing protein